MGCHTDRGERRDRGRARDRAPGAGDQRRDDRQPELGRERARRYRRDLHRRRERQPHALALARSHRGPGELRGPGHPSGMSPAEAAEAVANGTLLLQPVFTEAVDKAAAGEAGTDDRPGLPRQRDDRRLRPARHPRSRLGDRRRDRQRRGTCTGDRLHAQHLPELGGDRHRRLDHLGDHRRLHRAAAAPTPRCRTADRRRARPGCRSTPAPATSSPTSASPSTT